MKLSFKHLSLKDKANWKVAKAREKVSNDDSLGRGNNANTLSPL